MFQIDNFYDWDQIMAHFLAPIIWSQTNKMYPRDQSQTSIMEGGTSPREQFCCWDQQN